MFSNIDLGKKDDFIEINLIYREEICWGDKFGESVTIRVNRYCNGLFVEAIGSDSRIIISLSRPLDGFSPAAILKQARELADEALDDIQSGLKDLEGDHAKCS